MTKEKRKELYEQVPSFYYDFVKDGKQEEYALYDAFALSKEEVEEIRQATEKVGHIFSKATNILQSFQNEELYETLGYPVNTIPYLSLSHLPVKSVIARIDFAKTEQGLKVLEINADTPTFISETFSVNEVVCNHFALENPNKESEKQLKEEMERSILETAMRYGFQKEFHLVFTSHKDSIEDTYTCKYLERLQGFPSSFCYLEDLQIDEDGLYDKEGRRIDVLYRQTYPLEYLAEEQDGEGNEIGKLLLEHVKDRKVAMLNPFSAFTMQNKALQCFIWESVEMDLPLFDETEKEWVRTYFLRSYMNPAYFQEQGIQYVEKPIFGREGDTVCIKKGNGQDEYANEKRNYTSFSQMYQQYVDMPKHIVQTEKGSKETYLLLGSFLVNGKASAIGMRAGDKITGDEAYFLPIGIPKF